MENNNFKEWLKSLENMDFDHYSAAVRDKIIESDDMDEVSKNCFKDSFDYIMNLYKNNKPLDVKLLKIHLEEVKGYKNIKINEFFTIIILLSYCGFNLNFIKEDN